MAPTPSAGHRKAITYLKRIDPVMAAIIARVGPCKFGGRRNEEVNDFEALVRSITYQQLSGKAAATIYGRFVDLFPDRVPAPDKLLEISDEQMRSVGMSRQKTGYLRDLAQRVHSGSLPLDHADTLSDDDLIAHLVQVKGIGRWTAQMFLMFRLGRPDVLPELDLGIQNAIKKAYRLRKHPSPKKVREIGAKWTPYSSVASWYLWRSLE